MLAQVIVEDIESSHYLFDSLAGEMWANLSLEVVSRIVGVLSPVALISARSLGLGSADAILAHSKRFQVTYGQVKLRWPRDMIG